jgi:ribosomal protein S11
MTYTFMCPSPCNRMIRVDASSDDDAIRKLIQAGAVACRRVGGQNACKEATTRMYPLTAGQLCEVVRLSMTAEDHGSSG